MSNERYKSDLHGEGTITCRGRWFTRNLQCQDDQRSFKEKFASFDITHYCASQVALVGKNPPANEGDMRDPGSIPGSGRSPGGGHGNPL